MTSSSTPNPDERPEPDRRGDAELPAEPAPSTAANATAGAGTAPGRRRWWRPRRRWPVVTGAVVVAVLLLALAFGGGYWVGHRHGRFDHFAHGGHGWTMPGHHHRGMFGGQGGFAGPDGFAGRGAAATAVFGTVTSINGANLVITPDGAAPVTVTTGDRTRIVGQLAPGARVIGRVGPDHTAYLVRVVPAVDRGTVTAVAGDRITLTEPGGLTRTVDVSAVTTKPAIGAVVAVRGTATDNGGTLKAQSIRELRKPN
jgi:hypothetical protein